jgi:hypothetical protein
MKKMILSLQILFLYFTFTHHAQAGEESWKYKDWSVSNSDESVRYTTFGKTVWGHQFGFIRLAGKCNMDILWVSWSTAEKEVKSLKGIDATIQLRVGATKFQIEVPLAYVGKFNSALSIPIFTNFAAGDAMISLLETGQQIDIKFISPKRLVGKFDVLSDSFSLNGFTAARLKAREICERLGLGT